MESLCWWVLRDGEYRAVGDDGEVVVVRKVESGHGGGGGGRGSILWG